MSLIFDLDKPSVVVGSGQNADKFTLYLVKAGIQPAAFQTNENAATGNDLYLKVGPQPGDGTGTVKFDWSGQAEGMKDKFKTAETQATAVLLATSKTTNQHPDWKLAVGTPAVVKLGASIKITPLRANVTANEWVWYHHPICYFKVEVHGPMTSVTVDIAPKGWDKIAMFAVWEQQVTSVQWGVKKLVLGSQGNMAQGAHCNTAKCKIEPKFHDNGGWWGAVPGTWGGFHTVAVTQGTPYIFALYPRMAGTSTMTVTGTGPYAHLQQKVTFGMQGAHPHPGD